MEKIINFEPAYDKRSSDPKKNYGIHGVSIRFVLKGDKGAVQFLMYTPWHLPSVDKSGWPESLNEPMAADLGYHSLMPRYDGQSVIQKECPYLDGRPCYYDGSGLNAEPVMETLIAEGSDGVWKKLEEFYAELFEVSA